MFGISAAIWQYPALRYGGDVGDDCADPETTSVKSVTGPPICRTVLLNQPVDLIQLPPCTMDIPNTDNDNVDQAMDIDKDGDGLIEICDLEGLNEIRFQLDGSGYRTTAGATVIPTGCPNDRCTGYELTRDLDFMDDDSYRQKALTGQRGQRTPPGIPLELMLQMSVSMQHLTATAIQSPI